MKGGSLYISLSNVSLSIKCHLLIKIFLRFGADGLYCVTKGINPLRILCGFCSRADLPFVNLTSARTYPNPYPWPYPHPWSYPYSRFSNAGFFCDIWNNKA